MLLWRLFEDRFSTLIAIWRGHEDLRRRVASGEAPLSALAQSHDELEEARRRASEVRRAFAPEPNEMRDVAGIVHCDLYDAAVFVYRSEARHTAAGPRYRCVCGRTVPLDALAAPQPDRPDAGSG